MVSFRKLLLEAIERKASDLHITVGIPPTIRVFGQLIRMGYEPLNPEQTEVLIREILREKDFEILQQKGEIDTSYSETGLGRFRVNAFKQRGTYGVAIRIVALSIPDIEELGLPSVIKELANKKRGLVLVTGPTGSGKSTTLAAMVNHINNTRSENILTLEDPIEYLHRHNKSIVNQREIGNDSFSFSNALRSSLRQDPDVILVGEMRDLETISIALTAAETGHLVLSTLHTIGAAKTIDRIIDVFPPYQQQQIRIQLSTVLEGVVSQQLIPRCDGGGRVAALEIMVGTSAIRNIIREGKNHQIDSILQTGIRHDMKTMDYSISELCKSNIVSLDTALSHCINKDMFKRYSGM